jgi:hypothetical protein
LDDIYQYWADLIGVDDLHYVDAYTIKRLTELVEKEHGFTPSAAFYGTFTLSGGDDDSQERSQSSDHPDLFGAYPISKRKALYNTFFALSQNGRFPRSIKSIAKQRPAFEKFTKVLEQVPFWFDTDFRKGYQGGTSIDKRARVEDVLSENFTKEGYYAIMWYTITHYKIMSDSSKVSLSSLCKAAADKDTLWKPYGQQFKVREWYQLLFYLVSRWEVSLVDLNQITLAVRSIKSFTVYLLSALLNNYRNHLPS